MPLSLPEPSPGIEPGTYGLRNRCSTPELRWRAAFAVRLGSPRLAWVSSRRVQRDRSPLRHRDAADAGDARGDGARRGRRRRLRRGPDGAARCEERAAELLGKEAALFVPTGTMANQIALLCHCERGDEVLVGEGSALHARTSRARPRPGPACSFGVVGQRRAVRRGRRCARRSSPPSTTTRARACVALENTHNRAGGRVFPQADVEARRATSRASAASRVHLDGARIWNAAAATGAPPATLAAPADSVSVCFSKGLGAPVGSVLAGARALRRARASLSQDARRRHAPGRRARRRRALRARPPPRAHRRRSRARAPARRGLVAPAGRRLRPRSRRDQHRQLRRRRRSTQPASPPRAAGRGVLLNAIAPHRLRAVTHLDVSRADIDTALGAPGASARLSCSTPGGRPSRDEGRVRPPVAIRYLLRPPALLRARAGRRCRPRRRRRTRPRPLPLLLRPLPAART